MEQKETGHQGPRVSVLLPCRNAAPYLPDCINSLMEQSWPDFEVLAVEDHSTDETPAILAEWSKRDSRVRVITPDAPGLVCALNAGLAHARGEFTARMDADDVALPTRFEQQVRAFHAQQELVACGTRIRYFPRAQLRDGTVRYEAWLNSLSEPAQLERDIFVECPIAHPSLMIRTQVLRELGGYIDYGWPEDYDLIFRIFISGRLMRNVTETLLEWRDRPDRLSRIHPRYSEMAFRRCKVHYLRAWRRELESVVIWGAGPVGKGFAREFMRQGVSVRAFVDVDPHKIGQTIHHARVLSIDELKATYHDTLIVAAVSGAIARGEIRAALRAMGRRENADFVAVA